MPFDSELDSSLLDSVLDASISTSAKEAYEIGAASVSQIQKFNYGKLHSYKNVSSYSTQASLHACPRMFQIEKMKRHIAVEPKLANIDFTFGHAIGAGIAVYDETRDINAAIWAAFCAWDIDFEAEAKKVSKWDKDEVRDKKKSILWVVWALLQYPRFFEEEMGLADFEVQKVEAEILVEFSETEDSPKRFYAGHIDTVFKHKLYKTLLVKENKSTSFAIVEPQLYANSDQALSYSVVMDMFGVTDYDVLYCVYSTTSERWMHFTFPKSLLAKASWMQDQLILNDQLQVYEEKNFFPMRGASCLRFGSVCHLYGQCQIPPERVFQMKYSDLPVATLEDLRAIQPFEYYVKADDVIASLRNRVSSGAQSLTENTSAASSYSADSYMEEMK